MANFVQHVQCPSCAKQGKDTAGNNLAVYDDESTYCFTCEQYTKDSSEIDSEVLGSKIPSGFLSGSIRDLTARGITKETCQFFDYRIGNDKRGEPVHIANVYNEYGELINQKLRDGKKKFSWINGSYRGLYGQWKYEANPNLFVTITEGEIDALTIAQCQGLQWPVVSLSNGAASAKKDIEQSFLWLSKFKHVVLAFDNDEAGQKAIKDVLPLFEYGKVKVVDFGHHKDANQMLQEGKGHLIKGLLWNAKTHKPSGIVSVADILDRVLIAPKFGLDLPWKKMTDITYGLRPKEIYILVGGEGIGKTEIIKDIIFHLIKQDMKIGLFSFEQDPASTIQRLIGSSLKKKLHIPGVEFDEDKIREESKMLEDKLFLCDQTSVLDHKELIQQIRYLAKVKQTKMIVIDNLKGLCKGTDDENKHIKQMMLTFQALARELDITFFLLSHVAKDKYGMTAYVTTSRKYEGQNKANAEEMNARLQKPGMTWESGRMPVSENIEGSSSTAHLADFVFAIARNKTAKGPEQMITRVKCLKARLDGSKTGQEFKLRYNEESGVLEELDFSDPLENI